MIRILPPLSKVFGDAARLVRSRPRTLCCLALLPLLPLSLLGPFITEVMVAVDTGITSDFARVVSPLAIATAVIGALLSVAVGLASTVGMFVVYGSTTELGPRRAFQIGAQRWVAFLWTEVLTALAILLTAAPSLVFTWWAKVARGPLLYVEPLLGIFVLTIVVLLFLPVLVVATWYAFAPVAAARGEAAGSAALTVSRRLVQGATGQTFGLLVAWFLFQLLLGLLLAVLFPSLLLFQRVVFYFTVSVFNTAYLFTVYQALRRA